MKFTDDLTIAVCALSVGVIWWFGRNPRVGTAPTQAATPPAAQQRIALEPVADKWFASPISVGSVAIGMAEGNYQAKAEGGRVIVKTTRLYAGHEDPGNQVINYGFCSDQGRSGGDLKRADQGCLDRIRRKIPEAIADLKAAGIDPADMTALVNTADVHNQASPIHSRWFPRALARARADGRSGVDAIAWARTASFYRDGDPSNGRNMAGGLIGICRREDRGVSDFGCVYGDQLRRAKEIDKAIALFSQAGTTEGQRE